MPSATEKETHITSYDLKVLWNKYKLARDLVMNAGTFLGEYEEISEAGEKKMKAFLSKLAGFGVQIADVINDIHSRPDVLFAIGHQFSEGESIVQTANFLDLQLTEFKDSIIDGNERSIRRAKLLATPLVRSLEKFNYALSKIWLSFGAPRKVI